VLSVRNELHRSIHKLERLKHFGEDTTNCPFANLLINGAEAVTSFANFCF